MLPSGGKPYCGRPCVCKPFQGKPCNLTGSPSGDVCEESVTDNNGDGYDDVSYEAGYIAGHSDGVEIDKGSNRNTTEPK